MKLPRWLVITMLTSSALAVLAAAGWWWVTWPERTAREFVELMGDGRIDEASRILKPTGKINGVVLLSRSEGPELSWKQSDIQATDSGEWLDLLQARRRFRMASSGYEFTAQWGKVREDQAVFWIEDFDRIIWGSEWSETQIVPMDESNSAQLESSSLGSIGTLAP